MIGVRIIKSILKKMGISRKNVVRVSVAIVCLSFNLRLK